MKKVYVASSWRNENQQKVVEYLNELGFLVYDFKHPYRNEEEGFKWTKIDEKWENWNMEEYREALHGEYAKFGFNRDFEAMKSADICVLCLPCGRSAHLEAGWIKGAGKKVFAFIPEGVRIEPELMYGLLDGIALNIRELEETLKGGEQ